MTEDETPLNQAKEEQDLPTDNTTSVTLNTSNNSLLGKFEEDAKTLTANIKNSSKEQIKRNLQLRINEILKKLENPNSDPMNYQHDDKELETFIKLKAQIDILEGKINFLETNNGILANKIADNSNYYWEKQTSPTFENKFVKQPILNQLKDSKLAEKIEGNLENSSKWFFATINMLKDKLQQEKEDPIKKYESSLDKYIEEYIKQPQFIHRITWGMPKQINGPSNKFVDAFIYSSKTDKKIVYIPFSEIHKQLIKSNWVMREGEYNKEDNKKARNHLLAHLLFIISDKPHEKLKDGKYTGGRTFIDFPIIQPLNILEKQSNFHNNEAYENYIKDKKIKVGEFFFNAPQGKGKGKYKGGHSEEVLSAILQENIVDIVKVIKSKLMSLYGKTQGFKLYAVCLFINSQRNVCGSISNEEGVNGCAKVLSDLIFYNSFLKPLTLALNKESIKTRTKNETSNLPRMFITVSAHEPYGSYQPNIDALKNDQPMTPLYIDIKALAKNKVILSTSEKWIDRVDNEERQKNITQRIKNSSVKIPAYTGFVSGNDTANFLSKQRLQYDIPTSFDGIQSFTIKENEKKRRHSAEHSIF